MEVRLLSGASAVFLDGLGLTPSLVPAGCDVLHLHYSGRTERRSVPDARYEVVAEKGDATRARAARRIPKWCSGLRVTSLGPAFRNWASAWSEEQPNRCAWELVCLPQLIRQIAFIAEMQQAGVVDVKHKCRWIDFGLAGVVDLETFPALARWRMPGKCILDNAVKFARRDALETSIADVKRRA